MKEKDPLVSIVTPVYNMELYLTEAIESILSQDYKNIEYIVINDGSTDSTSNILKNYDKKFKIINQDNIGAVATLNKGWGLSSGKYLSYLSADDILSPQAISTMVNILESDEQIVCAYPNSNLIDSCSRVIKRGVCKQTNLIDLVIKQECYIGPGAVFRADCYRKIGSWDKSFKLAPDRDFWIKLLNYGHFFMSPNILAQYRMHGGSYSVRELSESQSREYIHFLDKYFSNPDIPVEIEERKNEAYGLATLIVAKNRLKDFDFIRGIDIYKEACKIHPKLKEIKYKILLARSTFARPIRAIQSYFLNLKSK